MWRKHLFLISLFTLSACGLSASPYHFRYTPQCAAAYRSFLSLQSADGRAALQQAFREDPDNLLAVYISDYDDFFLLLLNGDPADLEARKDNLDARVRMLDKAGDKDPYYRLCKSGIYLHWALIYGRFGDYFRAALSFRRSYVLIRENKRLFPAFTPNDVFYGLAETVAGTIPDDYKWLATILGMKGNVNRGIARIVAYINENPSHDAFLRREAVLAWCYLAFYLQPQKETVWKYINSTQFPIHDNLLYTLVKANLALNYRKADAALQTLQYAQTLPEYPRYPVMDYEMGNALLLRLDPDCVTYLQRYVSRHRSSLYIKDAWQQMALSWYLQQNMTRARYCREQVLLSGGRQTDADRQAQRFAEMAGWPHPGLLRARLLCDGGYYRQAMEVMHTADKAAFTAADSVEYHFRMGRIHDELGDDNQALACYQAAIRAGRSRKEHFAARSALQMALIYEQRGRTQEAAARFRECLSMRGHDFQASIDQQARAGLSRLEGKL